jgi:N-acetylglucosamine-6-phosphate deacetylase
MMTIAPELPGAPEVIEELVRNHIIASVGHTDGTFDQVRAAFDRGASHVTHMFNAMRGFHHREPGAVGAALRDPRPSLQVIADGYHLHPETISLLVQNKPLPRINLITDAMRCADMPDGCTYQSFGHTVTVQKGRVSLEDGTLAGSTLTMKKAVQNMRAFTGLPLGEVIRMASLYPAETIGLAGCKGSLAVGKDADIVLLDPNLEVKLTMVAGTVAYSAL